MEEFYIISLLDSINIYWVKKKKSGAFLKMSATMGQLRINFSEVQDHVLSFMYLINVVQLLSMSLEPLADRFKKFSHLKMN